MAAEKASAVCSFIEGLKKGFLAAESRAGLCVGMTGGVFDIIHPGHVYALTEMKKRCDVLIVSVAADETVRKLKGREPVHSAKSRAQVVESLKPVDAAFVGDEHDKLKIVRLIKPDLIFFGYDQPLGCFEQLSHEAKLVRIGTHLEKDKFKTSHILRNIRESHGK